TTVSPPLALGPQSFSRSVASDSSAAGGLARTATFVSSTPLTLALTASQASKATAGGGEASDAEPVLIPVGAKEVVPAEEDEDFWQWLEESDLLLMWLDAQQPEPAPARPAEHGFSPMPERPSFPGSAWERPAARLCLASRP